VLLKVVGLVVYHEIYITYPICNFHLYPYLTTSEFFVLVFSFVGILVFDQCLFHHPQLSYESQITWYVDWNSRSQL